MARLHMRVCCAVFAASLLMHADQPPKQLPPQSNPSQAVTEAGGGKVPRTASI